jgi:hypothetical protein
MFDWIWHVKGSVPLPPQQTSAEALDRLDPLFHEMGTSHDRTDDTLTYSKKDPTAQDKMSVFEWGILQVRRGEGGGSVLHYHLTSRALLFCFMLPFLFLAFAQLTIAIGMIESAPTEAAAKKPEKEDVALPQNPIDKFLGAPVPEKPKKKSPQEEAEDSKPSPTAAYVFAAIFATLFIVGRFLEAWLVRRLFERTLAGESALDSDTSYGLT